MHRIVPSPYWVVREYQRVWTMPIPWKAYVSNVWDRLISKFIVRFYRCCCHLILHKFLPTAYSPNGKGILSFASYVSLEKLISLIYFLSKMKNTYSKVIMNTKWGQIYNTYNRLPGMIGPNMSQIILIRCPQILYFSL